MNLLKNLSRKIGKWSHVTWTGRVVVDVDRMYRDPETQKKIANLERCIWAQEKRIIVP